MNYKQGLCATLLSTLVSLPAFADLGNPYVSGKVGGSRENLRSINSNSSTPLLEPTKTSEIETVWAFGGAAGYRFNTFVVPVRVEADYTYRDNMGYNADPVYFGETPSLKSTVQSQTILGNLYIDIPLVPMFGVFVGGGAGLAFNRTHNKVTEAGVVYKSTTDRNDVAWMGTAGLSLVPINWMAIDLSYRYSGLGSVYWSDGPVGLNSTNFTSQDIFLTFRFTLPSRDFGGRPEPVHYKPKPQPMPEAAPVRRKPQTKAPAYRPQKGAEYEPHAQKGPHYDEKGATYDPNRAKRVKKNSQSADTSKSSKKTKTSKSSKSAKNRDYLDLE